MKPILITALFLVSTLIANISQADVWAEREALAKIETELSSLESLVMSAKGKSNTEDRTTFDYEKLLDELRLIRGGISTHLSVPMDPVVPTNIDALSGEYTEHR